MGVELRKNGDASYAIFDNGYPKIKFNQDSEEEKIAKNEVLLKKNGSNFVADLEELKVITNLPIINKYSKNIKVTI